MSKSYRDNFRDSKTVKIGKRTATSFTYFWGFGAIIAWGLGVGVSNPTLGGLFIIGGISIVILRKRIYRRLKHVLTTKVLHRNQ